MLKYCRTVGSLTIEEPEEVRRGCRTDSTMSQDVGTINSNSRNRRKEDDETDQRAGGPPNRLHRPFGDGESGRCHPASAHHERGGVGEELLGL